MSKANYSIDEAADHLGVSTRSVRRYIALGYIKAHRVGPKLIRIPAASLDSLADGNRLAA